MAVVRIRTICAALLALMAGCSAAFAGKRFTAWQTVLHPRHGFQIAYPGNVFVPDGHAAREDGNVFVSVDGQAKLIVGAFVNESAATLDDYRFQLLAENYAGAHIDFAPVHARWFIVSGTLGAMHFYERVSFTCGGQMINSWALLYPVARRAYFDRVVEAIAPTYSPGSGEDGTCDR